MTDSSEKAQTVVERDLQIRHTVGSRIRSLREDRGWPQAELAGRTGIQVNRMSRIETGQSSPRVPDLLALRQAFGVSVDAILAGAAGGISPADPRLAEALRLFEAAAGDEDREALLRMLRLAAAGLRARRTGAAARPGDSPR
jgi:transcriptional regulator with XRE-family HTH domain